jgi:hypothetical protein
MIINIGDVPSEVVEQIRFLADSRFARIYNAIINLLRCSANQKKDAMFNFRRCWT